MNRIFVDDRGFTSLAAMIATLLAVLLALLAMQGYWVNSRSGDIQTVADAAALAGANALAKCVMTAQLLDGILFCITLVTLIVQALNGVLIAVEATLTAVVVGGVVATLFGGLGASALAGGWLTSIHTFRTTVVIPTKTALVTARDAATGAITAVIGTLVLAAPVLSVMNAMAVIHANNSLHRSSGRLRGASYRGFVVPWPIAKPSAINDIKKGYQQVHEISKKSNSTRTDAQDKQAEQAVQSLKGLEDQAKAAQAAVQRAESDLRSAKLKRASEGAELDAKIEIEQSKIDELTGQIEQLKTDNPDDYKDHPDWVPLDTELKYHQKTKENYEKQLGGLDTAVTKATTALEKAEKQLEEARRAINRARSTAVDEPTNPKKSFAEAKGQLQKWLELNDGRGSAPTFPGGQGFVAVVWDGSTHTTPSWMPLIAQRSFKSRFAVAGARLARSTDNTFMRLFDDYASPSGPLGALSGLGELGDLIFTLLGMCLSFYAKGPGALGDAITRLFKVFGAEGAGTVAGKVVEDWFKELLKFLGVRPPDVDAPLPVLVNTGNTGVPYLDTAKSFYDDTYDEATGLDSEAAQRKAIGLLVQSGIEGIESELTQGLQGSIDTGANIPVKVAGHPVLEIPIELKLPDAVASWMSEKFSGLLENATAGWTGSGAAASMEPSATPAGGGFR